MGSRSDLVFAGSKFKFSSFITRLSPWITELDCDLFSRARPPRLCRIHLSLPIPGNSSLYYQARGLSQPAALPIIQTPDLRCRRQARLPTSGNLSSLSLPDTSRSEATDLPIAIIQKSFVSLHVPSLPPVRTGTGNLAPLSPHHPPPVPR